MEMDDLEKSWQCFNDFTKSGRMGRDGEYARALNVTVEPDTNGAPEQQEPQQQNGNANEGFTIPELPRGRVLELKLMSTWGDPFYVGLNGVEVFTEKGTLAQVDTISACKCGACGACDAPDCVKPENLLSGNHRTKDVTKLWMARFTPGQSVTVTLRFGEEDVCISMMRIWNYNESRVHSSRGVRHLEMFLDGQKIFQGEISKALGIASETHVESLGDTILFTTDEQILELIKENDTSMMQEDGSETEPSTPTQHVNCQQTLQRPDTGDDAASKRLLRQNAEEFRVNQPLTVQFSCDGDNIVVRGKVFHMELRDNWGSPDLIGLTGLQFMGRGGTPISISGANLQCSCRQTPFERIFNGKNLTTNYEDMWLAPFDRLNPAPITLTITFPETVEVIGMSFWNFNGSLELSYAGVRCIDIYANGRCLLNNALLRKAPGFLCFDYVQDVFFDADSTTSRPQSRPASTTIAGFTYQLQLLSTWGDEFYIGLNGIEFFDNRDVLMKLGAQNLAAFPESVNVLPAVNGDPRTSDKLINGQNDTTKPEHMWLAPILPHQINRVFIIFDTPRKVSNIKVYNYRKTPTRGVREITLYIDDLIVFSGEVPISTAENTGVLTIPLKE